MSRKEEVTCKVCGRVWECEFEPNGFFMMESVTPIKKEVIVVKTGRFSCSCGHLISPSLHVEIESRSRRPLFRLSNTKLIRDV